MSTRRTTLFYATLISVASMAIGMVITSRLGLTPPSMAQSRLTPPMNSTPISGPIDASTFRDIAEAQTPMVVNIRTESRRRTQELTDFFGGDELFRRFFGQPDPPGPQPRTPPTLSAGTGFVIDAAGFILTNHHVVEGATKIEVGFFGEEGKLYEARIVGQDQLTDSALLELIERPDFVLPEAVFGDSDQMRPGDWVMAIGNPFNLNRTVTVGVISATGRPFQVAQRRWQNVLQTDAAINPGNSGGPLLNLRGEVVGINTAIVSGGGVRNLGIGFAIPSNLVRELLPQLHGGKVTRGWIGVGITNVDRTAVDGFGLDERMGAVVSSVTPGAPADRASVQPGDVIIEYNGERVESTEDLVQKVTRTRPGAEVPVTVMRDRAPMTLNVTIEELDLDAKARTAEAAVEDVSSGFGMALQDLTRDTARRLGLPSGTRGAVVVDLEAGGAAQRGLVRVGDVIIRINRTAVESAAEATRELQAAESGRTAFLLVLREGTQQFLQVTKD